MMNSVKVNMSPFTMKIFCLDIADLDYGIHNIKIPNYIYISHQIPDTKYVFYKRIVSHYLQEDRVARRRISMKNEY